MSPILPIALAYAALALVCAKQAWRTIAIAWAILAGVALGVALIGPAIDNDVAFTICWIIVLASAGTAVGIGAPSRGLVWLLASFTGMAVGLVAATSKTILPLIEAAPGALFLLFAVFPQWRGLTLITRIVGAWLIAVVLLSVAIPLVPTPGYQSDHRE